MSFHLHVYFIYSFQNIRSTFRHRQLIYHWCHCYSTSINDHILFCLQLTWYWYQPDELQLDEVRTTETLYQKAHTVSNAEISQTCHGTIHKRLWMILQQPHWLEMPLLKWSASTAQLSRRMLTIEGRSSIFGAKDFQQRSTTLWIFKFAPLLIPIIIHKYITLITI